MTPFKPAFGFAARYLLVACALAGALYSVLLARAAWLFQQDTASSVPRAVELAPFDSTYLARLAAWRPKEKIVLLERAVSLDPFDSESWIQLGFAQEFQEHNPAAAERFYLQAAAVNKMFLPKWTLVNFYFRRANQQEFFRWAKAALAITPYSPEPLFVQMWLMSQDASRIALTIPNRPRILLPYAWFLSNAHQYASVASIIERLMTAVGSADPKAWGRDDLLSTIEDRILAGNDRELALNIWSSMVKAGWLQLTVPSADHPLTNGEFRKPFFRHGFDWMPAGVDGVTLDQSASGGFLRLQFSGNEPEQSVLLQQYIPFQANREYIFRWRADINLGDTLSGLRWHLQPLAPGGEAAATSPDLTMLPAGGWRVRIPSASGIALLSLQYSRPLGHLRARGTVLLHSVSLDVQ